MWELLLNRQNPNVPFSPIVGPTIQFFRPAICSADRRLGYKMLPYCNWARIHSLIKPAISRNFDLQLVVPEIQDRSMLTAVRRDEEWYFAIPGIVASILLKNVHCPSKPPTKMEGLISEYCT